MTKIFYIILFILASSCENEKKYDPKKIDKAISLLKYKNTDAKIEGSQIVISIGQYGKKTIPYLINNLKNENSKVRLFSIAALEATNSKKIKNYLIKSLEDKDEECAQRAAKAILKIYPETGEEIIRDFLKKLLQILEDPNPNNRYRAAMNFGRLGVYATPAVEYLGERLLYDKSHNVRNSAAKALGKIGSQDGVKYLAAVISPFKSIASELLMVNSSLLLKMEKIHFSIYKLVPFGFEKIVDGVITHETINKLKKKPFTNHIFVKYSHIYYNDEGVYKKYFTNLKGRLWAKKIYIKSIDGIFTQIKRELIPELDKQKSYPIPGKKVEPVKYVRNTAKYSIRLITNEDPAKIAKSLNK